MLTAPIWMCSGSSARIRWRTRRLASDGAFVVVQDMFLTETAQQADVVLPAASAYEKNGTVTNVTGEVQRLQARSQNHGREAGPRNHRLDRARKWASIRLVLAAKETSSSKRSGRRARI